MDTWLLFSFIVSIFVVLLRPAYKDFRLIRSTRRGDQWSRQPKTDATIQHSERPLYVALGSSFAAAPGVGLSVRGSIGKDQGIAGYPFLLAQMLDMQPTDIINASSTGALMAEILQTQVPHVNHETKLVTITAGGNDLNYSKDMIAADLKARMRSSFFKWLLNKLAVMAPASSRPYNQLRESFEAVIRGIRERSRAKIVVVTYLTVLPKEGALPPLSEKDTHTLREVAQSLFDVMEETARKHNVTLVDVTNPSVEHDAMAPNSWTWGFDGIAPVHPNYEGHRQMALATYNRIERESLLSLN